MTPPRTIQGKKKRLQQKLHREDAYEQLNIELRKQNYDRCIELIAELQDKYPGSREVRQYQEEIEIRLLLQRLFKIRVRKARIRNILITVGIIFIIGFVLYTAYSSFNNFRELIADQLITEQETFQESKENAVNLLLIQAQSLLESQNLDLAENVIEQLEQLDPENPNLSLLKETQTVLSDLDELYQQAQAAYSKENLDEALSLYESILLAAPDFRDVSYQIEIIEKQKNLLSKIELGDQAYLDGDWPTVIKEYEEVLDIDSSLLNKKVKEELVNSYIESIILLLAEEEATIEEIERAEVYYKRTLALIPQSKDFEEERKTLDNLILNLLIVKYLEYADTLIDQSPFDEIAVKTALNYLTNAYHLDSDNGSLENEIDKTQYYYIGLQNFYDLDWNECIAVLEQLRAVDPEFGNHIGNYVLYEAYMAYGSQRASYGLFLDARNSFEEAEFLVWNEGINTSTRLFITQLNIAYSSGKSHSYEQAVSYYEYAVGEFLDKENLRVDYQNYQKLTKAEAFANESLYFDSFYFYADFFDSANDVVYDFIEIDVLKGDSLLAIAQEYGTSIQGIVNLNELPAQIMIISSDDTLLIPILP